MNYDVINNTCLQNFDIKTSFPKISEYIIIKIIFLAKYEEKRTAQPSAENIVSIVTCLIFCKLFVKVFLEKHFSKSNQIN